GCPDCGFTGTEDVTAVPATITEAAETWQKDLTRDDVSTRRTPGRWSDLDNAAHMRDGFNLFRRRTALMLAETAPRRDTIDGAAAESDADRLSQVTGDEWNRRGYRSDGREFTVASLTRYGLHEVRHHLGDVGA